MATAGKTQNKSEFVLELLRSNPKAKEKDAVAAWKQAGNEGSVSSSAFYSAKRTPRPGTRRLVRARMPVSSLPPRRCKRADPSEPSSSSPLVGPSPCSRTDLHPGPSPPDHPHAHGWRSSDCRKPGR